MMMMMMVMMMAVVMMMMIMVMMMMMMMIEVDWFSNIVSRELCKFEKKERQRLSLEVMGGLVEKTNIKNIVEIKCRMCVVSALQQSLSMLEHYEETTEELSPEEAQEKWFLEHNLLYIVEVTLKYQIKLPNVVNCPLMSKVHK